MSDRKTLYVVDGSYYIFRAYYGIRGLTNSKNFPTNGLFGFVGMLEKLLSAEKPEYLIVTFDPKGGSFRNEIYPEYKANRQAPPEDLIPQFPRFRDIVRGYNIPIFEEVGFEADDVMGTLARQAAEAGFEVVLITGDKDLTQLLTDHVSMLDTMRDRRMGPAEVMERFHVTPEQMTDLLGLWGDSSDNIPGVPGIGEKTASKLVAEYGSMESVYERIEDFKGKRKENLVEFKEQAFLSRDLATIRTNLAIEFNSDDAKMGEPDVARLASLFREFEFRRFLHDLEKKHGELPVEQPEGPVEQEDEEPVDQEDEEPIEQIEAVYRTITTAAELEAVVDEIKRAKSVSVDTETTSLDPMGADLVGISLSWKPGVAAYIPIAHEESPKQEQLKLEQVQRLIGPLLKDESVKKIGQHIKYDWLVLKRHGFDVAGIAFDCMLASYVLNPSRRGHSLDALAKDRLGYDTIKFSDVAGKGAKQTTFNFVPIDKATQYAAEDADIALRLQKKLVVELGAHKDLLKLHDEIELPLSSVLAEMEYHGVLVDRSVLKQLSAEFGHRMGTVETNIFEIVGSQFNINSTKQLATILFDQLGLPVVKRTKSGPSTDQSVLERLAPDHPVPQLVLEYRSLSKLKGTYTDALPRLINPQTGRIHTDFRQTVAATGRLSSNNPNLQNIPVRTHEGRRIREAFVAPESMVLLSADYSQVELRVLAHMSGDPVLVDAFKRGQDIHARTAAELFGLEQDQVDKEQRGVAKTINFGILYGMGAVRMSRQLGISRAEAKTFIERYFQRISGVRHFIEELVNDARTTGYAYTMFGRRRALPELQSQNRGVRALGERLAVNTPIQGTAADLIKVAMVTLQKRLKQSNCNATMLLQVHDELVFEVDEGHVDLLKTIVKEEMEGAAELSVPLLVDVGTGLNWAMLK